MVELRNNVHQPPQPYSMHLAKAVDEMNLYMYNAYRLNTHSSYTLTPPLPQLIITAWPMPVGCENATCPRRGSKGHP